MPASSTQISPLSLIRTVSESFVARYRAQSQSTDWGQSLAMYGLLAGYESDPNPAVRDYLRTWAGFHLAERVHVHYFCGSWSFGLMYPEAPQLFPEFQIQLRDTALQIYEFIARKALRNGSGTLLHNIDLPNIYIDTVYYSSAILAKLGPYLGLPWQDEAVKQIVLHLETLQDGEKPFFIHCEENNGGKRSAGSWARGNGWVMMALAEVIPLLDGDERQSDLADIFNGLCASLANYQTENGLWRTIIDDDEAYEEVSASAMYLYAYALGQRHGLLSDEYDDVIERAYEALARAVDGEGRVMGVSEGTWPGTIEYYKSLATGEWWWGTGAFLLAMNEMAKR